MGIILCFVTLFAQNDFEEYFKLLHKKSVIDFSTLQNPFTNPTFEKLKQIKIIAILLDRVKIDDKWYKKGDRINDAVIVEIDSKEIKFKYDNSEIKINLKKNDEVDIN